MSAEPDTMPAAHFDSQERLEETYWWHTNRRRIALCWLRDRIPGKPRLLDLGCGTGGFLEQLAVTLDASRALGLDASPVAIRSASAKTIDVRQADLTAPVQLDEELFDAVTVMDVLEHIPDEAPLLRTAIANLKPGAYLVASVPAYMFLFSTWDKNLGHYRRYTRPLLVDAVRKAGFEVCKSSYAFSYALLPAVIRRFFGARYSEQTCVFPEVGAMTNQLLRFLGAVESAILNYVRVPFGLSVVILARKPRS